MLRVAHILVLSLLGAVMVHAAIVLALPFMVGPAFLRSNADPSARSFTEAMLDLGAHSVGAAPFMRERICPYDFKAGGMRITLDDTVPLLSVAIIRPDGVTAFSSSTGRLGGAQSIALLPSRLRRAVALAGDDVLDSPELQVFIDQSEGLAVIRVFEPDQSWSQIAQSALETAGCELIELEAALPSS
jgi:uncharacterized membrane protein